MVSNKNLFKILYVLLIILTLLSTFYIFQIYQDNMKARRQSNLLNEIEIKRTTVNEPLSDNTDFKEIFTNVDTDNYENENTVNEQNIQKLDRKSQVQDLKKINSDIIGWIEIENTNISYPVLQGDDNSYYMTHDYKKQYSYNGSIFLDKDYNWNPPSSNLLIYGHNMKNNTMFQDLLKYKNKSFYENHQTIRFTTSNEDMIFDIIAAFESKVYYKSEKNVFRYYYFINSKNEQDYNNFVSNAKKASFYDTGKTATYGEQLMTLSTCSYHTQDGRFAVVARKVDNN